MAAPVPHEPAKAVTSRSIASAWTFGLHHPDRCHLIARRGAVWSAASVRGFAVERHIAILFHRLT
ncbi:hypothetical protein MUU53_13030 [Rhizobium lemnae]|uniref:Uncharacterized protein n=1 Tax=Rhizobium lemnae TaxID=1214924 RepID=A0ABV8E423_9HYPH|nr:hypothetical protein [Rhizobium lemnae]MCJ8508835.1 hypothetical protein [Rhizobium lemnae]